MTMPSQAKEDAEAKEEEGEDFRSKSGGRTKVKSKEKMKETKEVKDEHPHHLKFNFKHTENHSTVAKKGYVLGKVIGEGSYAKVYETEYTDPKTGKSITLAAKVINKKKVPKDFLKKFFPRELYTMSRVSHTNIVRLHSVLDVRSEERFYVFMQMASRGDLLEFIKINGAIVEDQARIWFTQFVKGMKYLHGMNIAHRDLKMENLLLTQAYNIKISDFGFARLVQEKGQISETFCGSICYAPPEILRGRKYNPKVSDLWSMGVVLFVMTNKSLPFDDKSIKLIYEAQMSKNWKFREKIKNKLSVPLKTLIAALLEPTAAHRMTIEQLWKHAWIQNPKNPELKKPDARSVRVHPSINQGLSSQDPQGLPLKYPSTEKMKMGQFLTFSKPPDEQPPPLTNPEPPDLHKGPEKVERPDSGSKKPNSDAKVLVSKSESPQRSGHDAKTIWGRLQKAITRTSEEADSEKPEEKDGQT